MYGAPRGSFQGDALSVDLDASDEDQPMPDAPHVPTQQFAAAQVHYAPAQQAPSGAFLAERMTIDLDASDEDSDMCQAAPMAQGYSSGPFLAAPAYQAPVAPSAPLVGRSMSFSTSAGGMQQHQGQLMRSSSEGGPQGFSLSHSGDSFSNHGAGGFFNLGSSMEISAGPMAQSFMRSSSGYDGFYGAGAFDAPGRLSVGSETQTYDLEEEDEVQYAPVPITYVSGNTPEQILFTAEAEVAAAEGSEMVVGGASSVLQKGEDLKLEQHLSSSSWIAKMNTDGPSAGASSGTGVEELLEGQILEATEGMEDCDDGTGLQIAEEQLQRREHELSRALAEKEKRAQRKAIVEGQLKRVTALLKERKALRAKKGVRQYHDNWEERTEYEFDEEDEELLAALCVKSDKKDGAALMVSSEQLLEEGERLERFFSSGRAKVSSNSIHDIGLLDEKEMSQVLRSARDYGKRKRRTLFDSYRENFVLWKGQMSEGFNVVLYGLGSKKRLMETFAEEMLGQHVHLVVNGYFPSLSLKRMLLSLSEGLFHCDNIPSDLLAHASLIAELFRNLPETDDTHVYLVVHSIDGVALRVQKAQEILCQLAAQPRIHMIASVDHLSAPFLWDYYMTGKFNFLWYETSTFEHYRHETRYESSIFSRGTKGSLGIRAAIMVLEGLPRKAHEVFKILALHQVQTSKGMIFQDLFRASREKFLVSRPNQLQAFLNEFREHRLIKLAANRKDGTQQYMIMMPTAYIHKIVADIQVGLHAASSADRAA